MGFGATWACWLVVTHTTNMTQFQTLVALQGPWNVGSDNVTKVTNLHMRWDAISSEGHLDATGVAKPAYLQYFRGLSSWLYQHRKICIRYRNVDVIDDARRRVAILRDVSTEFDVSKLRNVSQGM